MSREFSWQAPGWEKAPGFPWIKGSYSSRNHPSSQGPPGLSFVLDYGIHGRRDHGDGLGRSKKRVEIAGNASNLLLVDTPLLYHSNRGLMEYYKRLLSIIKLPVILHNDPLIIDSLKKPFKRNNIRTADSERALRTGGNGRHYLFRITGEGLSLPGGVPEKFRFQNL